MAAAADGTGGSAAAPLLSQSERDRFADGAEEDEYGASPDGVDEFGVRPGEFGARSGPYGAGSGEFGAEPVEPAGAARGSGEFGGHSGSDGEYGRGGADYRGEYGAGSGGYDAPPEREWPPLRRDDAAGYSGSSAADYSASRAADDTVAGLPPVPATHSAGPSEPEWPPLRDRAGAGSGSGWSDRDEFASDWSAGTRAAHAAADDAPAGYPAGAGDPRSDWSAGSGEREWPPGPAGGEWPPRRDPEAESGAAQRSWFEPDEPQAEPAPAAGPEPGSESGSGSWSAGPADPEWPPSGSTYRSGGRRSRHSDE
jgi:hypothetical protein